MEEYIPLISIFIGGIIGFLASFITNEQSNKFKRDIENKAFQRKKREELYYVIAKLNSEYHVQMGNCHLKLMTLEPFKTETTGEISTWSELSMIVNLYFPEFKEDLSALLKERDSVGVVLGEVILFKSALQKEKQDLINKTMVSIGRIQNRFEKFQEKVSNLTT